MSVTYYMQRQQINTMPAPTIQELQANWPFLFRQRWLCQHFETLTNVTVYTKLVKALETKADRVCKYFSSLGETANKDVRAVLSQICDVDNSDATAVHLLLLLMAYFHEKTDALFLWQM